MKKLFIFCYQESNKLGVWTKYGGVKAVEYTVQRVLQTLPTEHYKASFSPDPFINPGYIRMGPQLPSGAAIFRVPNMVKFWSDIADFEPKSQQQNFLLEGFSRAPCSNRILRNLDSSVRNSAQDNSGEGSLSTQPIFEVNLLQIQGNNDVHQNASESNEKLDSTVSAQFSNQNESESHQNLDPTVQVSNQSTDILDRLVQRTITNQENEAAIQAINAQNSNLLDEILTYSPISEEVDISQFPSTGENDDLRDINIDLFSSLDPEQSSVSMRF